MKRDLNHDVSKSLWKSTKPSYWGMVFSSSSLFRLFFFNSFLYLVFQATYSLKEDVYKIYVSLGYKNICIMASLPFYGISSLVLSSFFNVWCFLNSLSSSIYSILFIVPSPTLCIMVIQSEEYGPLPVTLVSGVDNWQIGMCKRDKNWLLWVIV